MAYTTIDNPELYFQCKLYTGTGSSNALTFDGDEDMQPDFVWIKSRSRTDKHTAWDVLRGVGRCLFPSENNADEDQGTGVTAFGSDGFTVGAMNDVNYSTATFASWNWKANGSGSSNTDGSINTTKTSANTTSGFSICQFTGSGSAATIGHGLSAVPEVIISKDYGGSNAWYVYHVANGNTHGLRLSTHDAKEDDATLWNDTTPTSTVYSVGSNSGTNDSDTMISYVFAPKQGFSKFGSYTGNGNILGSFIYTGFRSAFIITKRTDSTGKWHIYDNKRLGYNRGASNGNNPLKADVNEGEDTARFLDITSTGFRHTTTDVVANGSGNTYVYMAFAEAPFVNSKGVPCNAR